MRAVRLYHWHGSPRSATERSLSLQQELGTFCYQKWRPQSACEHLRLNLRLICFLPLFHSWLQNVCGGIGNFHSKFYCTVLDLAPKAEAAKAEPQNVWAEMSRNFFLSRSHKIFEPSRSSLKIFQFMLLNCT